MSVGARKPPLSDYELNAYEIAALWLKHSRFLTLIGDPPPVGEPMYLTLIVSGPPKDVEEEA